MRAGMMVLVLAGCAPEINESPLEGPGFDAEGRLVAEGETFVVGLTHLQVKNAPGPGATFGEHANAVGEHLYAEEPEGWLGAAFRNEGQLRWWTMTVWEDEQALLDFVHSEPHAAAMEVFSDIVVGGVSTDLEVTAEDLPMSWETGMATLLAAPDFSYGEPSWVAESAP